MSIVNRFYNIVKTNKKARQSLDESETSFTQSQLDELLRDETDAELKEAIDSLNNTTNFSRNKQTSTSFPPEILAAFEELGLAPTTDLNAITLAFRQKVRQCHPDKHTNATAQEQANLQAKSSKIIYSYNGIKHWLSS